MAHMKSLIEDPQPLLEALHRYPNTLLQGDLYKRNLAYIEPNQVVVVDWQLAMRSLMTIDLARIVLAFTNDALEQARAQDYYRRSLEDLLNQKFKDMEWQAMVDLGVLTEVLWITCYVAHGLAVINDPNFRHYAEMRIEACNQQVRDGVRWL